ncbi:MAG: transglycosylase domain-containing protein [Acidimicrobiales bacterium]
MSQVEARPAPPPDPAEHPSTTLASPATETALPETVSLPTVRYRLIVPRRYQTGARGLMARLGRFLVASVWMMVRWVAVVGLVGAVLAFGAVVALRSFGYLADNGATAVPSRPINFQPLATRSVVYARDGSVLTVLHAEEDRVPVPLEQVPPHVVRAVLDAEDERFFEHGPLDLRSLLRATVSNIEAGGINEGGSTLTQQLVKIELLTSKQDVNRKIREAILAVQMEREYSKDEILERYLNSVYFGNGAYGLQAAAETYFQTGVGQLTKGQAVLLAGLIRYPGGSDPYLYPQEARDRRALVADRMRFLNHLTPEEAEQIKGEPLPTPHPKDPPKGSDYFAERVKQELLAAPWLGETPQERYQAVFKGGLTIHTTLEPRVQQLAQDAVFSTLPEDPRGFTAALVSVEPSTGAVRALVGGPNFEQNKFNLVTDGDGRQTGSSFKTFTLIAALEAGASPASPVSGVSPCPIPNPGGAPNPWVPGNVEGQGGGMMTLTSATVSSVNCAYARIISQIGPQRVIDVARRMGITNPLGAHLSLTLGAETITPLEMASAYATLAADGIRREPYFVEKVEGRYGTVLFQHKDSGQRVLSPQIAQTATGILKQVVSGGTGTAAALRGRQAAGKTGSTDSNHDAWFVGFTPELSTAVWMGAPEQNVPMYGVGAFPRVYGGTYPAMMWRAFMQPALDG